MKRFYKDVSVHVAEGGAALALDGKPLTTPGKQRLLLPNLALAEAVAQEWQAQGETVQPDSMPLTQLCCTTLDLTMGREPEIAAELAAYGASDLLCYRAEAPPALVERQEGLWQPLLDWAAEAHGAPLRVTGGIMAVEQPPDSLEALRQAILAHRGFRLTALSQLVRATGSLVLGLALSSGRITVEEAFRAAELDALFQMELWGEDPVAVERQKALQAELSAAVRLLTFTRIH